ncbi:conserved hypothetical protein [Gammaproteobacteria bacterium]
MKILHITPCFHPSVGGIESFTFALLQSLRARGHENQVVASHNGISLPDETIVEGILVHRVPLLTALTRRDPAGILQSKFRTTQVKRTFCADIFHLHIGGPISALHLLTETIVPAPLVITVHDLPPPGQDSASIRQVLEKSSLTVAVSQIRLEECRLIAPLAAGRMEKIYVSQPRHSVKVFLSRFPTPLILMVGRQISEKGFDLAIDAFLQVYRHIPTARLVLAGDGPIHAALANQVHQLGLEEVVDLPGRLPEADLARLYQQAWVTLVPSRHSESFGLVALEAMQAGCPVIAARVGGLSEVIVDEETGLLIPPNNSSALANAILRLLENSAWAQELGQAGQVRANKVFSWETCVDQYEEIYQQVLGK